MEQKGKGRGNSIQTPHHERKKVTLRVISSFERAICSLFHVEHPCLEALRIKTKSHSRTLTPPLRKEALKPKTSTTPHWSELVFHVEQRTRQQSKWEEGA